MNPNYDNTDEQLGNFILTIHDGILQPAIICAKGDNKLLVEIINDNIITTTTKPIFDGTEVYCSETNVKLLENEQPKLIVEKLAYNQYVQTNAGFLISKLDDGENSIVHSRTKLQEINVKIRFKKKCIKILIQIQKYQKDIKILERMHHRIIQLNFSLEELLRELESWELHLSSLEDSEEMYGSKIQSKAEILAASLDQRAEKAAASTIAASLVPIVERTVDYARIAAATAIIAAEAATRAAFDDNSYIVYNNTTNAVIQAAVQAAETANEQAAAAVQAALAADAAYRAMDDAYLRYQAVAKAAGEAAYEANKQVAAITQSVAKAAAKDADV